MEQGTSLKIIYREAKLSRESVALYATLFLKEWDIER